MLQSFSNTIAPDNTSFSLCELILNLYMLTAISANSTFRTVFDFKKLTNILLKYLSFFCNDYKHLSFTNTPYQEEMNFVENNHLSGLLMSCPGL